MRSRHHFFGLQPHSCGTFERKCPNKTANLSETTEAFSMTLENQSRVNLKPLHIERGHSVLSPSTGTHVNIFDQKPHISFHIATSHIWSRKARQIKLFIPMDLKQRFIESNEPGWNLIESNEPGWNLIIPPGSCKANYLDLLGLTAISWEATFSMNPGLQNAVSAGVDTTISQGIWEIGGCHPSHSTWVHSVEDLRTERKNLHPTQTVLTCKWKTQF